MCAAYTSEIAKDLKCNLCAYDYTGYGHSAGRPSVADTLADIDAVFQWLLRRGVRRQRIVLYGQSLGSGPTLELAAREPALAGVILHAAFASGLANGADYPQAYNACMHAQHIQHMLHTRMF